LIGTIVDDRLLTYELFACPLQHRTFQLEKFLSQTPVHNH